MQQIELLAPAGSLEAFKAALQNGADAIYLAGNDYGARAYAQNFTLEQLQEVIKEAHVYGVKIYVTINTLIHEHEIEDCLAYVRKLISYNVDALIVADVGFLHHLRYAFPDLELHASTQMHVHNEAFINYLKALNISRVVLPRETSIEDIRKYTKLGIEVEVFVHGAICVAYSGQCLMSSLGLHRSGNQGACAQPCRMRYKLLEDGQDCHLEHEYLLSPKDLCTIDELHELLDAGVTSLKIEGRMKKSEYVALITNYYRQSVDAYIQGKAFKLSNEQQKQMQMIYHRGFTKGIMFHQYGSNYHHGLRPNHIGIEVGEVVKVSKDKIFIRLCDTLAQHDGIRILGSNEDEGFRLNFLYKDGLLVNEAYKGDLVAIDKSFYVENKAKVLKTSDYKQLQALNKTFDKNYRKYCLSAIFTLKQGEKACLRVSDGIDSIEVSSQSICEVAKSDMRLRYLEQLQKGKDTPFLLEPIQIEMEEPTFIAIKEINQMRRICFEQMYELRSKRRKVVNEIEVMYPQVKMKRSHDLYISVENQEQVEALLSLGIKEMYSTNLALVNAYDEVKLRASRVNKDHEDAYLIQEYGSVKADAICEPYLNVTNSDSVIYLANRQVKTIGFSLELTINEMEQIIDGYRRKSHDQGNFACMIYGKETLMISEYCVIQRYFKDGNQKHCGRCKLHEYALQDQKGNRYPILSDNKCHMRIMNHETRDEINRIKNYESKGIHNFFIYFTCENKQRTLEVMKQVLNEFN